MEGSILKSVGEEIVGIVYLVSTCMLLVVFLVRCLLHGGSDSMLDSIAILVYSESSTDSVWDKFWGAVLNAAIFVVVVTVVTFLLVLLFYFRCTKFLRVYMGIAAFTVLAYMGGSVAVLLIQALSIPIDVITSSIILYNFAVVGVFSVFFCKMPILFTQGYLIVVGMLVAFWFTTLPEWTTWVLLVAIALYDVVAVLTPGGPLNLLVELAVTRDEEIPALIYEARPVIPHRSLGHESNSSQMTQSVTQNSSLLLVPHSEVPRRRWKRRSSPVSSGSLSLFKWLTSSISKNQEHRVLPMATDEHQIRVSGAAAEPQGLHSRIDLEPNGNAEDTQRCIVGQMAGHTTSLLSDELKYGTSSQIGSTSRVSEEASMLGETSSTGDSNEDDERVPLMDKVPSSSYIVPNARSDTEMMANEEGAHQSLQNPGEDMDEGLGLGTSGAIKLGLGDFIFYSVLVGRAAMYDLMTVYACYLAIIAGLGATLMLLAVYQRALPALPISISLGVVFYFLTRFLLESMVVQCNTNLVFF